MNTLPPGQQGYSQPIYQIQPQAQQDQSYVPYNPNQAPEPIGPQGYHSAQDTGAIYSGPQDPITPLPRYNTQNSMPKSEYGMGYQPQSQLHSNPTSPPPQSQLHSNPTSPPPQSDLQYLKTPMPTMQSSSSGSGSHHGVLTAQYISAPPGVATSRASMVYKPVIHTAERFHYGMCSCWADPFKCGDTKCKIWCCGYWCPCILYSRIHHRLRSEHPLTINEHEFSSCNGQCWAYMCLGSLPLSFYQRNELRHKYKLNGSCCGDMWRHCCCSSCALCQQEKEILYRERELDQLVNANRYEDSEGMTMGYVPQESNGGTRR